ncbi:MAG TPA: TraB/GumN family protein [Nevskiaceae bacterium]
MYPRLGRLLASLAVAALPAWTSAAAAGAIANPAPFLWWVAGAHTTHYLLGSVHLRPLDAQNLPSGLAQAYAQSAGVVLETDLAALDDPPLRAAFAASARASTTLRERLPAPLYARFTARALALHMPAASCEQMRAWWCALALANRAFRDAGFSVTAGVDSRVRSLALADGKPVRWFEAPSAHLALFTGMEPALSRALLQAELEEEDGALASPEAVYAAWQYGEAGTLAAFNQRFRERERALYARLLADRNRAWMPRLATWLAGNERQLIVVGAAHLVGPDGLVQMLRAAGYRLGRGLAPRLTAAVRGLAGHAR